MNDWSSGARPDFVSQYDATFASVLNGCPQIVQRRLSDVFAAPQLGQNLGVCSPFEPDVPRRMLGTARLS